MTLATIERRGSYQNPEPINPIVRAARLGIDSGVSTNPEDRIEFSPIGVKSVHEVYPYENRESLFSQNIGSEIRLSVDKILAQRAAKATLESSNYVSPTQVVETAQKTTTLFSRLRNRLFGTRETMEKPVAEIPAPVVSPRTTLTRLKEKVETIACAVSKTTASLIAEGFTSPMYDGFNSYTMNPVEISGITRTQKYSEIETSVKQTPTIAYRDTNISEAFTEPFKKRTFSPLRSLASLAALATIGTAAALWAPSLLKNPGAYPQAAAESVPVQVPATPTRTPTVAPTAFPTATPPPQELKKIPEFDCGILSPEACAKGVRIQWTGPSGKTQLQGIGFILESGQDVKIPKDLQISKVELQQPDTYKGIQAIGKTVDGSETFQFYGNITNDKLGTNKMTASSSVGKIAEGNLTVFDGQPYNLIFKGPDNFMKQLFSAIFADEPIIINNSVPSTTAPSNVPIYFDIPVPK